MRTLGLFIVTIICLSACKSIKQMSDRHENKSSYSLSSFYALANSWDFFIEEENKNVVIVEYYPATMRCGGSTIENAMAIVKYENEIVRILDQCPGKQGFKTGDTLIFEPGKQWTGDLGIVFIDGEPNPLWFKHKNVLRTTFGRLRRT